MEDFNGIFFYWFCLWEALTIVKIDEVGSPIILASLLAFRAVPGEMSYFSALETGIRGVSCGGCIALEVALRAVPLVAVRVLSSTEVVTPVVSSVVSSCWCSVPIYVHRDWGVIHPTWGV